MSPIVTNPRDGVNLPSAQYQITNSDRGWLSGLDLSGVNTSTTAGSLTAGQVIIEGFAITSDSTTALTINLASGTYYVAAVLDPANYAAGAGSIQVVTSLTPPAGGALLPLWQVVRAAGGVTVTDLRHWAGTVLVAPSTSVRPPAAAFRPGTVLVEAGGVVTTDGATWTSPGPVWQSYTPTLVASGSAPSTGSGVSSGRYRVYGKTVDVRGIIRFGSGMSVGSGLYSVTAPPGITLLTTGAQSLGSLYVRTSGNWLIGVCRVEWPGALGLAVGDPVRNVTADTGWDTNSYIQFDIRAEIA